MNSRPIPFLDSIAYAYAAHAGEFQGDLSRVCFIFPNKRSGTFFRDRLQRSLPRDTQGPGPEITSISEVAALWSGRVEDSRIDLLLTLYDCYCTVITRMGGQPAHFAKFRSWGEVVLSDFNEVEMYMAPPEMLFRNIKSEKQIATDYLTEEQKALVEEYFGYRPAPNPTMNFWTHYNNPVPVSPDSSKKRFIRLWEVLYPLYELFCSTLEDRGLTFSGRAYRQALDNLQQRGNTMIPFDRVVLTGFNALTGVELGIFHTLAGMKAPGTDTPLADFYWDCTGVPLADKENSAGYFVRRHMKPGRFPSMYPQEVARSATDTLPERIELIASPSAVMQAKIAGKIAQAILSRIVRDSKGKEHSVPPERIAIVLPDEGLLLPMLYSLPSNAPSVNVTMGYPLRLTSAASFVRLARTLQAHSRMDGGQPVFVAEDVSVLLAHPFVTLLLGSDAVEALRARLRATRSFTIEAGTLAAVSPKAASLFTHIPKDAGPDQTLSYLKNLLTDIRRALESPDPDHAHLLLKTAVDSENLRMYIQAMERLGAAFRHHGIHTDARTLMLMAEKVLAGERVHLEGQPLRGLQVMGMLETRCLDFDYVIITSMNEDVYPRRLTQRTFIPENLRAGYSMASMSHRESIFAYYFYRMISRAKEVYMIYDSRAEGLKSGDLSRYALQLRHLYARDRVRFKACTFSLQPANTSPVAIIKTPQIISQIEEYFTPGSGKALSVSSLQTLMSCSLLFYLRHMRRLREEDETTELMTAAQMGTVMHAVMEEVYRAPDGSVPFTVTEAHLTQWITGGDNREMPLERLVRRMINRHFYQRPPSDLEMPLPTAVESHAKVFRIMARQVIDYDRTLAPFTYLGGEEESTVAWDLGDGMVPNMLYLIDRRDMAGGRPRIVDYKTGGFHLKIDSVADLFSPGQQAKALFQLITYACLQAVKDPSVPPQGFSLQIYPLGRMVTDPSRPDAWIKNTGAVPVLGGSPLKPDEGFMEEFRARLRGVLAALRDPKRPFTGSPGGAGCSYCPFRDSLCGV